MALISGGGGIPFRVSKGSWVRNVLPDAVDNDLRVSFADPTYVPQTGAGLQEFRLLLRKRDTGGEHPLVRVELWESGGGAALATVLADTQVGSTTGEIVSAFWNASLLTDADGSSVECQIIGTGSPGGTLEVGAVEWNTADSTTPVGGGDVTLSLSGVATEESVGTLTAVPEVATLTLTGLSSEESVGTLTAVPEVATLTLTGLSSEESVGSIAVSGEGLASLTGLASEESVGTLTAVAGGTSLALTGLSSEESISGAALTPVPGTVTLALTGLSSEESVGTLSPFTTSGAFARVAFDTPGGQLETGAGLQEFRILVRKTPGSSNPDCLVEVAESGSAALATVIDTTAVTSTTGVVLSGFWDASVLGDLMGAGVEALVTGTPGVDSALEVGAIEWNASSVPVVEITGVPSEETPGTLVAQPGGATLTLAGLSSEESVGTLTPVAGAVTAALTGLSSEESIGTLTAVAGAVTVVLTGLSTEESVGTLTPVAGAVSAALTGLSSEESVGALTPSPGVVTVTLTGLSSEETVGTLTPTQGVQNIPLSGVLSEEIPWENYPLVPSGTLVPTGFEVPGGYYGVVAVPGTATQALVGLASEESVGTLTAIPGVRTLALVGLVSEESVGTLTTSTAGTIGLTGVASEESVGTLTPVAGVAAAALSGLSSEESVGTLTAAPGARTLSLVGLASEESVGTLTPVGPPVTLTLTGLASEEAVGLLSAIFVGEYVGRPHFELTNERKIGIQVSVRKKPMASLALREKPQLQVTVRHKPQPQVAVREKAEFTLSSF